MIKQRLVDKTMKCITSFYEANPQHFITPDYLVQKRLCRENEVNALVDTLVSRCLISISNIRGDPLIILTERGKNYTWEKAERIKVQRASAIRSWIALAISFFALIVSIASLVRS